MHRILQRLATAAAAALIGGALAPSALAQDDGPPPALPAETGAGCDSAPVLLGARLPAIERGPASWYAHQLHGRRTSSGERYDRRALTAAHPTLPIPSYARVRNPANGREVVVRINDRGPFHRSLVIDVSHAAAVRLGLLRGPRTVEIEPVSQSQVAVDRFHAARPAPTATASRMLAWSPAPACQPVPTTGGAGA